MRPDLAQLTVERIFSTKDFISIIKILFPAKEIEGELLRRLQEDSNGDLLFQLESLPVVSSSSPVKTSGRKPRRKFDQKEIDTWVKKFHEVLRTSKVALTWREIREKAGLVSDDTVWKDKLNAEFHKRYKTISDEKAGFNKRLKLRK